MLYVTVEERRQQADEQMQDLSPGELQRIRHAELMGRDG